jgi:LacI family transcriptional regulator
MKVRLKDVAALAGVAVNTASTILNRRPNSWASKETEARVFKAAEELGYKPNRAAVGLRSGRFNTLGLLIPDLHNPFYTSFADLLEAEAEKCGYDLILESWRVNLQREQHCLHDLIDRQVDGVASFLSDHHVHQSLLAEQARRRRPFVAIYNAVSDPLPVDSVLTDFSGGLREAVESLFARGHRRFAFLCALAEGQDDGKRPELFRQMLSDKGIASGGFAFVRCGHSIESAHAAALQLLSRTNEPRPTALIALNDLSAIGAIRAAVDAKLQVPRDLSVVGVDDIPFARFHPVSLATIAQPIDEMARKAVEMLVDRIENPDKSHVEQCIYPTRYIPRESVAAAPKTDRIASREK